MLVVSFIIGVQLFMPSLGSSINEESEKSNIEGLCSKPIPLKLPMGSNGACKRTQEVVEEMS